MPVAFVMTNPEVLRRTVTVNLENGLHMYPCSVIANLVRKSGSTILVRHGEKSADARHAMDLMILAAEQGTVLALEGSGPDAPQVLDELQRLFEINFNPDQV